jgi:hypothetical protein
LERPEVELFGGDARLITLGPHPATP